MKLPKTIAAQGVHEKELNKLFGPHAVYDGAEPLFDGPLVLLGFNNRSGSNLLASHIRSVRRLTGFHEQLNWGVVAKYCAEHEITRFSDYIHAVSGQGKPRNRIHGFKASWDQIAMLMRFGVDRMYGGGVKVIHITRNDIIGQAISLSIATQTEQWTSNQTAREGVTPVYDAARLSQIVQNCCDAVTQVQLVTQMAGADYLQVSYEDVVDTPTAVMRRIGRFLGLKLTTWEPGEVGLQKQASALNEDWRARYLAESRSALLR